MKKGQVAYVRSKEIADKIAIGQFVLHDVISKSRVWSVFAKIVDEKGVQVSGYVCCRICKKVFTFSKTACTSNLVKHKCYTYKYMRRPKSWSSLIETEASKLGIRNSSFDYSIVDNNENNMVSLITKCLIKNCRSYDLIHDDDFKAVLQQFVAFGANFGASVEIDKLLPSSIAVARNLNENYLHCFERVKTEIASIKENGFGITVNVWEENFLKIRYVAVTVHFFLNGSLTCRFLGVRSMEDHMCGNKNISEVVQYILQEYDCKLSSKTIIVTSGCEDKFEAQSLPCISHLLNNALQKSVEEVLEIAQLLNGCTKLVDFLKTHDETSGARSMQSYGSSRWTSIYSMLNLVATHWDTIDCILRDREEALTENIVNLRHLRAVLKIFEPFKEAIETLENSSSATLHLVIIYLHELKKCCDANDAFEHYDFIEKFKLQLRLHLQQIATENVNILHKLALFLYPPTKKLVQFSNKEKESIEAACIRLMKCYENESEPAIKQEPLYPSTPVSKRRKLFSDFVDCDTNKDSNEFIIQELQIYKVTRVIDSEDFDVFNWWELQKDNFPLLYKLSRTVLATPASSHSAQQIFASAGSLLCDKISGLDSSETNVEHLLFIKFNAEPDCS